MSDDAELERIEREARLLEEALGPMDRKCKTAYGQARQAWFECKGASLDAARESLRLARVSVNNLRLELERIHAMRFGDQVEADQLARRAEAKVGWQDTEATIKQKEDQKILREVIPLKASEIFDLRGKNLATFDVLEAMAQRGVDSKFIGEYLAELVSTTRSTGSINQRREVMKLLFLFLQHIEPKMMLDVEDDLEDMSDEELQAYQTLAARMVAKQVQEK